MKKLVIAANALAQLRGKTWRDNKSVLEYAVGAHESISMQLLNCKGEKRKQKLTRALLRWAEVISMINTQQQLVQKVQDEKKENT